MSESVTSEWIEWNGSDWEQVVYFSTPVSQTARWERKREMRPNQDHENRSLDHFAMYHIQRRVGFSSAISLLRRLSLGSRL